MGPTNRGKPGSLTHPSLSSELGNLVRVGEADYGVPESGYQTGTGTQWDQTGTGSPTDHRVGR